MDKTTIWLIIGFSGQFFFTSRFLVQWFASEKLKKSVVPTAFWYLSLLGGTILLAYALNRRDPVFILGQLTGILIYLRNLHFIRSETRQTKHVQESLENQSALAAPVGRAGGIRHSLAPSASHR